MSNDNELEPLANGENHRADRDENGRFLPGNPGGPGRPKGHRNDNAVTRLSRYLTPHPEAIEHLDRDAVMAAVDRVLKSQTTNLRVTVGICRVLMKAYQFNLEREKLSASLAMRASAASRNNNGEKRSERDPFLERIFPRSTTAAR